MSDQIHVQAILRPNKETKYIHPSLFTGVGSNNPREKRQPVNNWLSPPHPQKIFYYFLCFCLCRSNV